MKKQKRNRLLLCVLFCLISLLFLYPLLVVFMNSVKPLGDIVKDPLGLPKTLQLENFKNAWQTLELGKLLRNTAVITAGSVLGITMLAAMAAYWCERHVSWFSRLFACMMRLSVLIPFATIMIPLVSVAKTLHLNNSLWGTIIIYWGLGLAFAFFILRGTVKGIPYELEEAAMIDGCGPVQRFWFIAFPLMRTGVISVGIMDVFWVWNDFMTPLILMNNKDLATVQLGINRLFGVFSSKWDLALAGLTIAIIPVTIVFILLQKKIMAGVMAGAVKG